ncbi:MULTISPECIES: hypothetical protein [Clostridium]|jgi:hypothetical protein|uniref:hypothetical protein n=1 Tax=Clostridium TaxID=1485 RepID=UPI0015D472D7|nr:MULTISPECIES: hypothetical protein [Clostridium]MDU4726696.1 hypothetical protein [Clostridium sp.]
MGRVINLNTKEVRETNTLREFIDLRELYTQYGIWLGKNGLEDTILNYEKYLNLL